MILSWALASAWIAVGKGKGRWLKLVMAGDLFMGLSMTVSLVFDDSRNWKFQLGENFSASGIAGWFILLCFFTLPFVVSAIWAAGRSRIDGPAPPVPSQENERGNTEQDGRNTIDFRLNESRV